MRQNLRSPSIREQVVSRADATRNHGGGLAFTSDARTRLYTRVCASLAGEPKFYADGQTSDVELLADVAAAAAVDPEFVLRLAAYTRQVMHIRSTPIVVLAMAASIPACKPFVRRWTPEIVRRADEPAEVIAAWTRAHGPIGSHGERGGEHAFPNCLTRGLADALGNFGEYHFAKYDRDRAVKLRDVLRIVRPKPGTPERSALYRYLVKGELDAALLPKLAAKSALLRKQAFDDEARALAAAADATWEVLISHFGAKAETWNALRLPFMAGMRNIANLMRNGADEALDRVIAMLRNPEHVRRSRQLPFRFYSAYRVLDPSVAGEWCGISGRALDERIASHPRRTEVMEALLAALEASVVNLPRLAGRTFITADNSGSMQSPVSERSTVALRDVANLLGAIAHTMCDQAVCSVFGESHKVVPVLSKDSIITNMARLANTDVGHATNAYLAVRHLRETKTRVDRIILFSDMQCYDSAQAAHGMWHESVRDASLAEELRRYRSQVNPGVFLYSVDLAGYGTAQFPSDEPRVALLAGWSERLLEFIPSYEEDGTQAVARIARWETGRAPSSAEDDPEAA
ncbi:TROVE domain-containing protein [Patescibacteria group bacterium]|nr:MAG: TROVE domain-containing protein [Patescibacteria group bacterium]